MNIILTKHVLQRFKQRFRLYHPKSIVEDDFLLRRLISSKVESGRVCWKWTQYPFYKNMLMAKHGSDTIIKHGKVFFVCKKDGDKLLVKTCLPNWIFEE